MAYYHLSFLLQLKSDFIQLLKDTSDIDRHSRWSDVKRKIDSDPRYKAVDSSSRREDWFKDYVRNLEDVSISDSFILFFRFRTKKKKLMVSKCLFCDFLQIGHNPSSMLHVHRNEYVSTVGDASYIRCQSLCLHTDSFDLCKLVFHVNTCMLFYTT